MLNPFWISVNNALRRLDIQLALSSSAYFLLLRAYPLLVQSLCISFYLVQLVPLSRWHSLCLYDHHVAVISVCHCAQLCMHQ